MADRGGTGVELENGSEEFITPEKHPEVVWRDSAETSLGGEHRFRKSKTIEQGGGPESVVPARADGCHRSAAKNHALFNETRKETELDMDVPFLIEGIHLFVKG